MKRFTETDKWKDPWFRKLPPKIKLLWSWLCDQCDAAGFVQPDWELISFQTGEELDGDSLSELGDRVEMIGDEIWVRAFVAFQYGALSRACKPHMKVIAALERRGISISGTKIDTLSIPFPKGIQRDKEEEEDKEEDKKEGGVGETKAPPALIEELVNLYPGNGNRYDAMRYLGEKLSVGINPETIRLGVLSHRAAIAKLPKDQLRWVPSIQNYFLHERWRDDPAGRPWSIESDSPQKAWGDSM